MKFLKVEETAPNIYLSWALQACCGCHERTSRSGAPLWWEASGTEVMKFTWKATGLSRFLFQKDRSTSWNEQSQWNCKDLGMFWHFVFHKPLQLFPGKLASRCQETWLSSWVLGQSEHCCKPVQVPCSAVERRLFQKKSNRLDWLCHSLPLITFRFWKNQHVGESDSLFSWRLLAHQSMSWLTGFSCSTVSYSWTLVQFLSRFSCRKWLRQPFRRRKQEIETTTTWQFKQDLKHVRKDLKDLKHSVTSFKQKNFPNKTLASSASGTKLLTLGTGPWLGYESIPVQTPRNRENSMKIQRIGSQ